MKYSEVENLVEQSIAERYCTFAQICRFIETKVKDGLSPIFLQEVTDGMLLDRKLVLMESGNLTAYFMPDKKPHRFWLDGTGKVDIEFNGHNMKKIDGRPKIKFDYERLEQIVSEVKNDTELAKRLNVNRNTILRNKADDEKFLAAYNRGKAKRNKALAMKAKAIIESNKVFNSPNQAAKSIVDEIIGETETNLETFEPETAKETPQKIKENITENITIADFDASDESEKQATVESETPILPEEPNDAELKVVARNVLPEETEPMGTEIPDSSKNTQIQTVAPPLQPIIVNYPVNKKIIPLQNGGEIEITIRANFFDLTREERELFDVLTDLDKSPMPRRKHFAPELKTASENYDAMVGLLRVASGVDSQQSYALDALIALMSAEKSDLETNKLEDWFWDFVCGTNMTPEDFLKSFGIEAEKEQ